MKKHHLYILLVLLLLLALNPAFSQQLQVTHWSLSSEKLNEPVRFAVLSDLHNSFYGENQAELAAAIREADVDAVLMCGDMADDAQTVSAVCALVESLNGKYPIYYVSGNHECDNLQDLARIRQTLRNLGVIVLTGESALLRDDLRIAGMDDPKCLTGDEWQVRLDDCRPADEIFTVLLAHRPDRIADYEGFDLVLTGHAHGGQLRIFGRGLWAPDQGLLPKFTSGFYSSGDGQMFVSRGLAKGLLPRFLNRPELAVIEINPAA